MPAFLESALRHEAKKKGLVGKHANRYVFGAMQHIGAMSGPNVTAKGEEMQRKHDRDMKAKSGIRRIRVKRNKNLIPI
jgi:hypothetical protein